MPLPLAKLISVIAWLEENANDVVLEVVKSGQPNNIPNPMVLITKVMSRVNFPEVVYDVFSYPKDPDTKEPINKKISKEFFEEYLDIPTAHHLVKEFAAINQVEELIKNFQSLPITKKAMEAVSIMFGIPYLNSLQQNTVSTQTPSEGSQSHKSTDTSKPITSAAPESGMPTDLLQ